MQIKKFEFKSFGFEDQIIEEKELDSEILQINTTKQEVEFIDDDQDNQQLASIEIDEQIIDVEELKPEEISNEKLFQILEKINSQIESYSNQIEDKIKNISKDLSALAVNIAKKIAGRALNENPLLEIEVFLEDSFKFYRDENDLNILLNPEMIELVSDKIEKLYPEFIAKHGVKFIEKSDLNKYDCLIDWHNGSLIFKKEEIIKRIEKLF